MMAYLSVFCLGYPNIPMPNRQHLDMLLESTNETYIQTSFKIVQLNAACPYQTFLWSPSHMVCGINNVVRLVVISCSKMIRFECLVFPELYA